MAKRPNHQGSIKRRKYKSGTMYLALCPAIYAVDENGNVKCIQSPIGQFRRRADAEAALAEFLQAPPDKVLYTLRQIYTEWSQKKYEDEELDKSTVCGWKNCWNKVLEYKDGVLANTLMIDISTQDVRDLLVYYGPDGEAPAKLSKSYLTKLKSLLKQLFDYAISLKIPIRNYASLAKVPKAKEGQVKPLTNAHMDILREKWDAVAGGDSMLFLCYTGLRVTEFCQLTKESYNPLTRCITGGIKTEAGKNRIVPIHDRILPIINRWYENASSGQPLYPRKSGRAHTKDSYRTSVWMPATKKLGFPDDYTPHSARHTCCTMLSEAGGRAEDIIKIVGHEDYNTTVETYIDPDIDTLFKTISKLK